MPNRAENSGASAEAKSKGFADSSSAAVVRLTQFPGFLLIPKPLRLGSRGNDSQT